MATNALKGSIVSQNYYSGGWVGYRNTSAYAGTNQSAYYPYILKFTTPDFLGASESVTFTLGMTKGTGATPTLRYALCTSDANKTNYQDTNAAVTDANQIAAGTFKTGTLSTAVTLQTLSISTAKLEPSKTYYLFLWGYASQSSPAWVTVNDTSYHAVSVAYNSGLARIGDGSNMNEYQCYIGNGTNYDGPYIPYVGNGTGWDIQT